MRVVLDTIGDHYKKSDGNIFLTKFLVQSPDALQQTLVENNNHYTHYVHIKSRTAGAKRVDINIATRASAKEN